MSRHKENTKIVIYEQDTIHKTFSQKPNAESRIFSLQN